MKEINFVIKKTNDNIKLYLQLQNHRHIGSYLWKMGIGSFFNDDKKKNIWT